jgi:hypothetical protein
MDKADAVLLYIFYLLSDVGLKLPRTGIHIQALSADGSGAP